MKPLPRSDTQCRLKASWFEFKAPAGTTGLSATYGAMPTKPTGWGVLREPQWKSWQRHWLQYGLALKAAV